MSAPKDGEPRTGRRVDGEPYKDGNTRDDGSYRIGKNRPPPNGQFRTNDGRARGRRAKGTKNLLTEWREELDTKIQITENGEKKQVTKRRALIKSKIDRGLKASDRASDAALRFAELSEKREAGLQADDLAIIDAWLACLQDDRDTDDADMPLNSSDAPRRDTGESAGDA